VVWKTSQGIVGATFPSDLRAKDSFEQDGRTATSSVGGSPQMVRVFTDRPRSKAIWAARAH